VLHTVSIRISSYSLATVESIAAIKTL
jgi:hypothetical protein